MNHYTIDQIHTGMEERFTVTITPEMMEQFYDITGDCSPIHIDAEYAAGRGYPGRVVYGMLSASLLSTLAGVYLPGEHCLLHQVDSKFTRPVFIGDTLTVVGTVTEVNETFREITIRGEILNQDGKKVVRATIKAGLAQ